MVAEIYQAQVLDVLLLLFFFFFLILHQRKKNLRPDRPGGQAVQAVKTKIAGPVGNAIAMVARTPLWRPSPFRRI